MAGTAFGDVGDVGAPRLANANFVVTRSSTGVVLCSAECTGVVLCSTE